jgi:hypothetical protein
MVLASMVRTVLSRVVRSDDQFHFAPLRLAYWARGWDAECSRYSQYIWTLYKGMEGLVGDVLVENSGISYHYLIGGQWSTIVHMLIRASDAKWYSYTDTSLDDLIAQHMEFNEKRLENSLARFSFHLDSADMVPLVCGKGRLGKVSQMFALCYSILDPYFLITCMSGYLCAIVCAHA